MGSGHSGIARITSDTSTVVEIPDETRQTLKQDPDNIKSLSRFFAAKTTQRNDIAKHRYDQRKENMQLLKQLFKSLDPTLLQVAATSSRGELQLAFKYESVRELLLVQVVRARQLDARDLRGSSADAYVKLFLHPALPRDDAPVKTTEVVRKTLNPTYREMFAFAISDAELRERHLVAQVWDSDAWAADDDFIGEAVVPLDGCDFETVPTHLDWYSLQQQTDFELAGELEVSVCVVRPAGVLAVTVHRVRRLPAPGGGAGSRAVRVKLQVPGTQAGLQQTTLQSGRTDAVWEETFQLAIPLDELASRYVVFHAVAVSDSGGNESLGQGIVELGSVVAGQTVHTHLTLTDLKNSGRFPVRYIQPTAVQELREALVAHAASRTPQMIFSQHSRNKEIKVTSKKSGLQAKLKLIDGIPVK